MKKKSQLLIFISEKGHSITDNIFDKRDSLNTFTTEIIGIDKTSSIYIPLKNGILVNRGVISYTVEIKEI